MLVKLAKTKTIVPSGLLGEVDGERELIQLSLLPGRSGTRERKLIHLEPSRASVLTSFSTARRSYGKALFIFSTDD